MSRSASRLVRVLCSIWFTTVDAIIIRMNQPSRVANQQRKNTPAPVCVAPPSWGRHPKTFTKAKLTGDWAKSALPARTTS